MKNVIEHVSCLIKTREYNVGFPDRFSHYPENMEPEREDKIHALVLEAMQDPGSISDADGIRRIVIGDGKYMVLGISGYLGSVMPDLSDEYHSFCDLSEMRKSYGFAGFVWDLKASAQLPQDFPKVEEFAELFKIEILPHWKDSANSVWAENVKRGISVPYDFRVCCETESIPDRTAENRINTDRRKVAVFQTAEEGLVQEAMFLAARRQEVSLCTDLDYYEEAGTGFLNLSSSRCKEERGLYDNICNDEKEIKGNGDVGGNSFGAPGSDSDIIDIHGSGKNSEREYIDLRKSEDEVYMAVYYKIKYSEQEEVEYDVNRLYGLLKYYFGNVNGELLYYGRPPTSFVDKVFDGILNSQGIICVTNYPLALDSGKLYYDLSQMIWRERQNGHLFTMKLIDMKLIDYVKMQSIVNRCKSKKTSSSRKEQTRKRSARNDGPGNNDKYGGGNDSVENLTEQLTELFGNGGKAFSTKNNKDSSNFEDTFSL